MSSRAARRLSAGAGRRGARTFALPPDGDAVRGGGARGEGRPGGARAARVLGREGGDQPGVRRLFWVFRRAKRGRRRADAFARRGNPNAAAVLRVLVAATRAAEACAAAGGGAPPGVSSRCRVPELRDARAACAALADTFRARACTPSPSRSARRKRGACSASRSARRWRGRTPERRRTRWTGVLSRRGRRGTGRRPASSSRRSRRYSGRGIIVEYIPHPVLCRLHTT